MNKLQLIQIIRREMGTHTTLQEATNALNATLSAIQKAVDSEPVRIAGFGTFALIKRAARPGRNPRTGEPALIPANKCLGFKASPKLKQILPQHHLNYDDSLD